MINDHPEVSSSKQKKYVIIRYRKAINVKGYEEPEIQKALEAYRKRFVSIQQDSQLINRGG